MRSSLDIRYCIPPACLYRLDARPGLCSDVSDPLLRPLAESKRTPEQALHVLATGRTFPAPLFLFLAGVSIALVTEKLWEKNLPPVQIARATIRRGADIFAFGLLFRLQEYIIAWGWAPLSDLLRVDVLNTIGARPDKLHVFFTAQHS